MDPVLWVEVPVDVSVKKGVTPGVTVDVTIGVCSGIACVVLVGGIFPSDVDEYLTHPQQHIRKMINPVKMIQEFNLLEE
jgi:hypothetical protein